MEGPGGGEAQGVADPPKRSGFGARSGTDVFLRTVLLPLAAQVFQWKEGKSRNLRALLCSLDTIIWPNSRWTSCGMHQVRTPDPEGHS
jgi:hypothetical protein